MNSLYVRTKDQSFKEQRNFFILNRIACRLCFYHKAGTNRDVLAKLIRRYFGVSLVYPNLVEQTIKERFRQTK
jgi:hypothetical protein